MGGMKTFGKAAGNVIEKGLSKYAKAADEIAEGGPKQAKAAAADAAKKAPGPKDPHPTIPGRNRDGTFTGKGENGANYGKAAEKQKLDDLEAKYGPIERQQVKAKVDGVDNGRFYDGLIKNPDGTYTGVEVKSGGASLTKEQRAFDGAVNPSNPARATLNGQPIVITRVLPPFRT